MKTRAALILAVLGGASSAFAQIQNTEAKVRYTINWVEAHKGPSGNFSDGDVGNSVGGVAGTVDPNEGTLITITLGMYRTSDSSLAPVNSSANNTGGLSLHWAPSILVGSSGTGTLAGFWGGDVNLQGGAGSTGTWSDSSATYSTALQRYLTLWGDSGAPGTVQNSGSTLSDIQPSQFGANSRNLLHDNDQVAWQGMWIPSAGAARTVNWNVLLGSLALLSQVAARDSTATNTGTGFLLPIALSVATEFGPGVNIPVAAVPGPSSLALLGLGGLIAARRRR